MMGAVPVLILLLAWIGWTLWGPQEGPDEPPRTNAAGEPDSSSSADAQPTWTLEEARQLVSVSQQALGHLENLELEAADPPLVDLAQKLPQEPLGPRNLTICRFLAFDGGKGTRESVLESLKLLRAVQPEDAYTFWLEAKTALKESANQAADPAASEQQLRQAITALRAAADRAPRNDAVRYQLFEAARNSTDPTLQAAGEAALEEAYQIDPDNLFTLSDCCSYKRAVKTHGFWTPCFVPARPLLRCARWSRLARGSISMN